eukprot:TRINITY_DN4011_c0_g2_i1.p1 TRINITY_DN4011_c0_g2~~TRINITY_DN4011_c0_g2_i1.p1  ORF type:complete len:549 (+),score=109.55 TRINITY_DN4011_c0_g2_i1:221-1648(+)
MIAVFSALGSTLFGLDIGYIGPIVESASFEKDVVHVENTKISSGTEGLIVSLFSLGAICVASPVVSSYFLDNWGRRASIMLGSVIFILGSLIQGSAVFTSQLLAGRFVAGMSIGLLSSVIVLYQSEVAPASMRGALSTLYQLGITFGILVAAYIDQLLVDRNEGWRVVTGIICLPALGLLVGMSFLPRSPRWLVQVGRREEALRVLKSIRSEEEAVREEAEIAEEIEKAAADGAPAWSELLHGRAFRLCVLGVTLQFLQQLVGMNAFMYFGPKIFESVGFSKNLFTTINNLVNFLLTIPAVLLADLAGRRQLMLWSSVGMFVSCMLMGTFGLVFVEKDPLSDAYVVGNSSARWVITLSIFFFVFNFAYGIGPIVWVYCSEIFPLRYRARCIGVSTMANWVGNFIIAQFTPMLLDSIGFGTFYVFGFFCFVSIFLSAWLPETKGVPLELVQDLFDGKAGFGTRSANAVEKKLEVDV